MPVIQFIFPNICKHSNIFKVVLWALICNEASQFVGFSQASLNDVDLLRIPQKKVRIFIHKQINQKIIKFSDVHPTLIREQERASYRVEEQVFTIKENIARVWQAYRSASPSIAWSGRVVSFAVLFSKHNHSIEYSNSNPCKLDTG